MDMGGGWKGQLAHQEVQGIHGEKDDVWTSSSTTDTPDCCDKTTQTSSNLDEPRNYRRKDC